MSVSSLENCGNNIPQITCSKSYLYYFSLFHLTWPYNCCLDHHPRIIGNENVIHSRSHAVSNGMWALRHLPLRVFTYSFRSTKCDEPSNTSVFLHFGFYRFLYPKNQQKPGNRETRKLRSHFLETSDVYIFKKLKKPTETLEI